jgi:hypothetical protein
MNSFKPFSVVLCAYSVSSVVKKTAETAEKTQRARRVLSILWKNQKLILKFGFLFVLLKINNQPSPIEFNISVD